MVVAALTYPVRRRQAPWPWGAEPDAPPAVRPRVTGPRTLEPGAVGPRRPAVPPAVLLRRRLAVSAALFVILAASVLAVRVLAGLLGSSPPIAPEQVPALGVPASPAVRVVHVVQPGDTLWQIARQMQPTGDVRPLVDRWAKARHGRPLQVGEAVVVS